MNFLTIIIVLLLLALSIYMHWFTEFKTVAYILIFVTAILFFVQFISREGFTNLQPGTYPVSVEQPILYGDYPVKNPPHLSNLTYDTQWVDYPKFLSDSCKGNNIRYWPTPDIGNCAPAEFCNSMYNPKKLDIPPPPVPPEWGTGAIRVNFYDTLESPCE